MVRKQVGSNQYRTRLGTETSGGPDLMAQAQAANGGERRRCGEVWGTACQAWVQGPTWAHGSHPANPQALAEIDHPDRTIDIVGISQLSYDQLTHLARNRRLGPGSVWRLINDQRGLSIYHDNDWLLGACVKSWNPDQAQALIKRWPPHLPPARSRAFSGALVQRLSDTERWELVQDPNWGELALTHFQGNQIRDPEMFVAVWTHTKQHGTRDDLLRIIRNNPKTVPLDIIHEVLATDILGPYDTQSLVYNYHQHLTDDELQKAVLSFPNGLTPAMFTIIQDRPIGRDLRWLWEASSMLRSPHVDRYLGGRTSARHILLAPGMPPAARLHYLSVAIDWTKNSTDASMYLGGDPPIPTETIAAAYSDNSIRSRMTVDARERLVLLPQFPPEIIAQEAKSTSPRVAISAALHPSCPTPLVIRALSKATPGTHTYNNLLQHPNMPETYKLLARL